MFGRDCDAFSPEAGGALVDAAKPCLLRAQTAAIVLAGMTMLPLDATGAVMGRTAHCVFGSWTRSHA